MKNLIIPVFIGLFCISCSKDRLKPESAAAAGSTITEVRNWILRSAAAVN